MMSSIVHKYRWECSNCSSRYYVKPVMLNNAHPVCTNCFEKCSSGHVFGYGESCNICGSPRRKFNLVAHEVDPDDPTIGLTVTGSTSYPAGYATTNYGDTNTESNKIGSTAGELHTGTSFTTTATVTVSAVAIYQQSAGSGHMHFGIYDSSGSEGAGSPGTLISGSDSGSLAVSSSTGWVTYTYTTPFTLAAGTYWLAFVNDTTVANFYLRSNSSDFWYVNISYGALPTSPWASAAYYNGLVSAYVIGGQIQGLLHAMKATLADTNVNVQSLSFYTHNTGNFRLALYSDTAGVPNGKLWESGDTAAGSGIWNTASLVTPYNLATSGTYWLAWQWNGANSGPSYTLGSAGTGNYALQSYGTFPSTWSGGSASTDNWSEYATYTGASAPLSNPPYVLPLRSQRPRLAFFTKNKAYTDVIEAEISPPSGNTLGRFRFVIPDKNQTEERNFGDYERIWVSGKIGTGSGRVMRGVVDRTMPYRTKGGYWALEIVGRDVGMFLDVRRYSSQVTFSNKEISQIILDSTNGPVALVPELTFSSTYINSTSVTLVSYTIPRGMSCLDLLRELSALASTPSVTWGMYVDQGEQKSDYGSPNVHFGQIKQTVGLVPIVSLQSMRTLAPKDWRQIITRVSMGYDNGCYSDDTEVLTDNGWKLFNDLLPEEKVATVTKDGYLEYHTPYNYVKYYYQGKMFHQKGKVVDLLVTPNHDMYVKTDQKDYGDTSGFKRVNVANLPKFYRYKRDVKWIGVDQETTNINGLTFPIDVWLKFFGIWLAEGYTTSRKDWFNHRIGVSQVQQDKMDVIEGWVKDTGLNYKRGKKDIVIQNNKGYVPNELLYQYLRQFGKAGNKFIPKELKNLPPNRLRLLLDSMILGDGRIYNNTPKYWRASYATISKRLADDVQEIAIKAGYSSNVCTAHHEVTPGLYRATETYHVYMTTHTTPASPYNGKGGDNGVEWVDYSGFVYDVTVDNHTLLVRRKGKTCWSGNSGGNLPNAFTNVDAYGPGVNSTYAGSFNGTTGYVSVPHQNQLSFS